MMAETVKLLQDQVRIEVSSLRAKATELESQVLDMRLLCNTKVSVEDLGTMLDRKLQVLSEYRRDTELVNQRCSEIT